jgi:hypothetical protein
VPTEKGVKGGVLMLGELMEAEVASCIRRDSIFNMLQAQMRLLKSCDAASRFSACVERIRARGSSQTALPIIAWG